MFTPGNQADQCGGGLLALAAADHVFRPGQAPADPAMDDRQADPGLGKVQRHRLDLQRAAVYQQGVPGPRLGDNQRVHRADRHADLLVLDRLGGGGQPGAGGVSPARAPKV